MDARWIFLAYFGLSREMHVARELADADDRINTEKATQAELVDAAVKTYNELEAENLPKEELCSRIYKPFAVSNGVSKPTAAQYLADILEAKVKAKKLTANSLRALLPPYLVEAITYVTAPFEESMSGNEPKTVAPMDALSKEATAAPNEANRE